VENLNANPTDTRWTPPYVSFKTLMTIVTKMESEGTPPRIDRSYLDKFAGGYQTQIIAALRSLDLIDAKGEVQPSLVQLVDDGDHRAENVARVVRQFYPEPVRLGTMNATQGQLEEAFRDFGVSGDTLRKAIGFYIAAAKYGQVPLSKNFRVPPVTSADGRRAIRRKPGRPRSQDVEDAENPFAELIAGEDEDEDQPKLDPAVVAWVKRMPVGRPWPAAKKDHWFETFRHIVDDVWSSDEEI
jgi:hypothetical protein